MPILCDVPLALPQITPHLLQQDWSDLRMIIIGCDTHRDEKLSEILWHFFLKRADEYEGKFVKTGPARILVPFYPGWKH